MKNSINIKKILIIGNKLLGDSVDTFSSLKALKTLYPDADLHLLAYSYSTAFYNLTGYFLKTYVYDKSKNYLEKTSSGFSHFWSLFSALKDEHYDLVLMFPGGLGHALLTFLLRIPIRIGSNSDNRKVFLTHHSKSSRKTHNYLNFNNLILALKPDTKISPYSFKTDAKLRPTDKTYCIFAPCSSEKQRMWPKERFIETGKHFSAKGITPVLLGLEKEQDYLDEINSRVSGINLAGKHSIPEVISIIKNSIFFIGNDTGLSHIAGMLNIPSFIIFGPSNPTLAKPEGENVTCIYKDFPDIPHELRTAEKHRQQLAIHTITAETVINKIEPYLHK
jgi:ADP-heptose:LPS heptosyltransferase